MLLTAVDLERQAAAQGQMSDLEDVARAEARESLIQKGARGSEARKE